nr:unnamed protein product [Callosobruchus chinensis]
MHNSCVPKKHQKHLPDVDDNDLFLCHNCYEEGSETEAGSEGSFEEFENVDQDLRRDQNCKNKDSHTNSSSSNLEDDIQKERLENDGGNQIRIIEGNQTRGSKEKEQVIHEVDEESTHRKLTGESNREEKVEKNKNR